MLLFKDVIEGNKYRNKKNGDIYTLDRVEPSTEGEHDVRASYSDEDGYPWSRPLGLFMVKFEKATEGVVNLQ